MRKNIKRLALIMAILITSLSLIACSAQPSDTMNSFLENFKKQDFKTAMTFVKTDVPSEDLELENEEQKKIMEAVLTKLEYEILSTEVKGDKATAKVKITSCNLPKILTNTLAELLPTLFASAFSQENIDDAKAEAMMMEHFLKAINDPNAPTTVSEMDVELVKENNKWVILVSEPLFNALTGNFNKMSEVLNF
ncbi:DUF4878 domain-containing protein [Clostridium sp. MSJ-11]|uniref:DUF4878 domain-containing protein n=1 Tax=Clostridium mobile TaxID=2841512 RepID=A0ABS6EJW5_9CLOT|nr:DUF4878 domain-containing protein [Clostridium mobile]MBU5484735.1 DUF4878 domain-containing protein [Clostridium mobile]